MLNLTKPLTAVALALTCLGLQAEDFSSLMTVTKDTWPEKTHIGVLCDYSYSRIQIEDLARAAGAEALITVVDVRQLEKVNAGAQIMADRKADYLVVLPKDRWIWDGSFGATLAINRLAIHGIPAVGTTPLALTQGAVFSMGEGTNNEVLVADRLKGTVDVTLPEGTVLSKKASMPLTQGMARIAVFSAQ